MHRQPEAARRGIGIAAESLVQQIGHLAEFVEGQEAIFHQRGAEIEPALDQPLAAQRGLTQPSQSLRESLAGKGAEELAKVVELVFEAALEVVEGGLDLLFELGG